MDIQARHVAQRRVDRIQTFREELSALEQEHALTLTPEQRAGLVAHHEELLSRLTAQFDLDVTEAGRRISWGVRLASLLGGAAFFTALILFLHRIWGALGPASHSLILTTLPLAVLAAAEITFRRYTDRFYAALLALAAGAGFVVASTALGSICNLIPSAGILLVWGSFALLVAHAYGLRLLLGAGLVLLAAYLATIWIALEGGDWAQVLGVPESLIPGAVLVYLVPWLAYRRDGNDFGFVCRMCGAALALMAMLILSFQGNPSHLPFRESTVEAVYQVAGLGLSAAVVYHGVRLGRSGLVNLGALAFVVFLYVRLHAWWWEWMPKSLFFLLIGLLALGLIFVFRRLRIRLGVSHAVSPSTAPAVAGTPSPPAGEKDGMRGTVRGKEADVKRLLIFAAAGVVLAANAWMLLSASRNRSGAPGGTVELTERELRLSPIGGESTALFLELEWDAVSAPPERRQEPQWLDTAKLSELGFNCAVPVTDPEAENHYRALMTRSVFLVLEYEGEAWKLAPTDRRRVTRLFAVDAGLDPDRLRQSYADAHRYIIARALVRVRFHKYAPSGGIRLPQPRVQGWIETLQPSQIFVPRPHRDLLKDLVDQNRDKREEREAEPRFAATVAWGTHYEPWVRGVRLLASTASREGEGK